MATLIRYVRQADLFLLSLAIVANLAAWLWWRTSFDIDVGLVLNATFLLLVNTIVVLAIRARWSLAALAFASITLYWNVGTLLLFYHIIRGG